MQPRIVVLSGIRAGEVCPLTADAFLIGRDEQANLFIDDMRVSRRHCAVTFENGEYQLEDSGSNNGTTLNGEAITGKGILRHGDRIGLSDTELLFLIEGDSADAEDAEPPVYLDDAPLDNPETVDVDHSTLQLSTLIGVANAFRNTRDVSSISEKLISLILATIPAERVAILLKDSDESDFESRAGRDRRYPARSIQASRSIANRVYSANAPILSNDLDFSGLRSIKSLQKAKVCSLVCVPLATFDRRHGVIYADTSDPDTEFDKGHLEWLTAVATMAALAFGTTSYIEGLVWELSGPHNLVGESRPMKELRRRIARVAPQRSTVLILGESGTGKELVARAIHLNSNRAKALFVAVNCATLTGDLLENELFGHEPGAYTGANRQHRGKIERASGGTLFLDEIAELNLAVQAKLLRVLQEREVERIGGSGPIPVDIRLIAATNRDLAALVAAGRFREDLFYRLNVVPIRTPPLRERLEDILVLARHFLMKYAIESANPVPDISLEAKALLLNYAWPGNVRELENAMENAIVSSETGTVRPEDLLLGPSGKPTASKMELQNYYEFVKQSKIEFLANAMTAANGDRKQAASSIGLHPHSLDRLIKNLGMTDLLE